MSSPVAIVPARSPVGEVAELYLAEWLEMTAKGSAPSVRMRVATISATLATHRITLIQVRLISRLRFHLAVVTTRGANSAQSDWRSRRYTTNPSGNARAAAAVRFLTPKRSKIFSRCLRTVGGAIKSRSAIWALL